jgi:adenosylcobinamide-GDP ribazoletransferase
LAPVWARWTLLLAAYQPSARPDGLGAGFAAGLTGGGLISALATAAIATIAVLLWRGPLFPAPLVTIFGAIVAVHAVAAVVILFARRRLGGVTGDVFGLVVESSEIAFLLALAWKG